MKRTILIPCVAFGLLILSIATNTEPWMMSEAATSSSPEKILTVPLFELVNERGTAILYTADPNEKGALEAARWKYMGTTCYVIPNTKQVPGSVGMYRLTKHATELEPGFSANIPYDNFFFTSDKKEADYAANNLGWRIEGIAFYVSPKPVASTNTVELLRLYHPPTKEWKIGDTHYFTTSTAQKDYMIGRGYLFDKVEAYVWNEQVSLDSFIGLRNHTPIINTGAGKPQDADTVLLNLSCTRKAAGEYNCNNQRAYETCHSYKQKGVVKGCFTTVNPKVQEAMDKLLFTVGCSRFLGRADEFTCKTQKGLDLCETYRKNGNLKKCVAAK